MTNDRYIIRVIGPNGWGIGNDVHVQLPVDDAALQVQLAQVGQLVLDDWSERVRALLDE